MRFGVVPVTVAAACPFRVGRERGLSQEHVELMLQLGRVAGLHLEAASQTLNLDLLLLDETPLCV
jgi:hypothetical protein